MINIVLYHRCFIDVFFPSVFFFIVKSLPAFFYYSKLLFHYFWISFFLSVIVCCSLVTLLFINLPFYVCLVGTQPFPCFLFRECVKCVLSRLILVQSSYLSLFNFSLPEFYIFLLLALFTCCDGLIWFLPFALATLL